MVAILENWDHLRSSGQDFNIYNRVTQKGAALTD
jgi:hypothetical protein